MSKANSQSSGAYLAQHWLTQHDNHTFGATRREFPGTGRGEIGDARFSFFIYEQYLVGTAGNKSLAMRARSGGRSGATTNWSADNPYGTRHGTTHPPHPKNAAPITHGGPLPEGLYRIFSPVQTAKRPDCIPFVKRLGRAAYLESRWPGLRGRFYIHRGTHTDGCVVIDEPNLGSLFDALDESQGGLLVVMPSIEPVAFA